MRRLVPLLPLLLAGCSLSYWEMETPTVTIGDDGFGICRGTGAERECLTWSASEHAGDDAYTLDCVGVTDEDCRTVAEQQVANVQTGQRARWVVVWPDWYEVCWEGPQGSGCGGASRESGDGWHPFPTP